MNLKKAAIFIILSFCFQGFLFADENTGIGDKVIGSTFKALAKTFVATVDFDALKKDNINKLKRMDEGKFHKRYAEVYAVIKDLPLELRLSYKITEKMTKEEAVKCAESLDREKAYVLIDSVPNAIIAKQFEQYLSRKNKNIHKSSIVEDIGNFWNKITKRSYRKRSGD